MNMTSITPQLQPSLLMPSIDLTTPVSPRVPSRYSTPLLDDRWDTFHASTANHYTPTGDRRGYTPRRMCDPYGSPSNPFRYHSGAVHGQSPVTGVISSRVPVDLHRAIQRISAAGVSPWTTARTKSEGWKEHSEEVQPVETMVQVLFWAAVVVLFSALLGVGEKAQPNRAITTRAWCRHESAPSGLAGMGWKGEGMVDWAEGLAASGIGKGIQGIWDDELEG